MNEQQLSIVYDNALVLSKGAELTSEIVKQVAGNAVSNSINNSEITASTIEQYALMRFQNKLRIATSQ